MIICNVCEGKKIVPTQNGNAKICPACKGSGQVNESKNEKPKELLKG